MVRQVRYPRKMYETVERRAKELGIPTSTFIRISSAYAAGARDSRHSIEDHIAKLVKNISPIAEDDQEE